MVWAVTSEALFEAHMGWAVGLARKYRKRLCPEVELDECEQLARIALWRVSTRYSEERGPFRRYASVRIIGTLRDAKDGKRLKTTQAHPYAKENVLDQVILRERCAKLKRELRRWKPLKRKVTVLYFGKGYTAPEVAKKLGIGLSCVNGWIRRIRKKEFCCEDASNVPE